MSSKETPIDLDAITEDDRLQTFEKETTIRWSKVDDTVHIHSDMAGVCRRLLQHPEFTLEDYSGTGDDVNSVRGTFPLGCLSIGVKPRKTGSHADVVSSGVMRQGEDKP